ncbi:MAG: hypothetical protein QXP95_08200 [Candidatus Nezhaarchaeales archaeon]
MELKVMGGPDNHYKVALIKSAVLKKLKSLTKGVKLDDLAEELELKAARSLLERALKELEEEGYVTILQNYVEKTWALRQCDEKWRPRGIRSLATIKTSRDQDVTEVLVIKGLEEIRRAEPLSRVLAMLSKAKLIAENAQTPKALHYARHLMLKAVIDAIKLGAISKSLAERTIKSLEMNEKLSRKTLLMIVAKVEDAIKGAQGRK